MAHTVQPKHRRKRITQVLWFCAAIYLLVCAGCATWQRHLIYFPPVLSSEAVESAARKDGLEPWKNDHGDLIGWKRMSLVQPAQGQVIVVHGNAGCAFQCAHYADAIQPAVSLDIYMVEYPGYADRPGKPTEQSLDAAAVEGFHALPTNLPTYVVGESLGTGVATYLAGHFADRIAGVVLLAPYNSLVDVGQAHMKILPVGLILRDRFPSQRYLRDYHGPVAMLVAGDDPVIPEKFGRRLYEGYAGPKRLWEFPEGNHGTVMMQPPEVWREIFGFLRK